MREAALITPLGYGDVDRDRDTASSALERLVAVPLVRKKMLTGCQKERTEPSAAAVGAAEIALLDESGEEPLRQVLRLVGSIPLPPHEGENRIPVEGTEAGKRLLSARRAALAGGEHETPLSRREMATAGLGLDAIS